MIDAFASLLSPIARQVGAPLLLFDTAQKTGSVALITSERVLEATLSDCARPSDGLLDAVADLLKRGGVSRQSLGCIVVGIGPGSFTGVRVALATAKGLAQGLGCALLGASSLALLALHEGPGRWLVGLPVGGNEVLATLVEISPEGVSTHLIAEALYTHETLIQKVGALLHRDEGLPLKLIGVSLKEVGAHFALGDPRVLKSPRASLMALLVQERLRARDYDAPEILVPRYLNLSAPERLLAARQSHAL